MIHDKKQNIFETILYDLNMIVIVFSFFLGISFSVYYLLAIYPKNKEEERQKRISKEKDFINHGIASISIVTNNDWTLSKGARGGGWASIKYIYVNNKLTEPDSLYRKDEFIFKYCGEFYTLYGDNEYNGNDSIVHEFYPKKTYYIFNENRDLFKIRPHRVYFKGKLITNLKNKIPPCL